MSNILVTGGAGYIGSHAAKALADAGHTPVTYDNLSRGNRWAVQWGPLVEGDLRNRDLLVETFKRFEIAAVIHFAAFAFVGESMTQPELYFENNVAQSFVLFDAMRLGGVRDLVFSSTCATYGIPDCVPISETTAQNPVNAYGETKLMMERAMYWYGLAGHLNWTALRYFNAAGADAGATIGEDHVPETHLIPLVLDAALGHRPAIDIYGTDYPTHDGTCIRDYIHVTDLADAHVKALQYLQRGGKSIAINLGTGQGLTVREVIAAVERVTGKKVPRREIERRAGDPAALVADPSLANSVLGWHPTHSDIDMIVATAWKWHLRHHLGKREAEATAGKAV